MQHSIVRVFDGKNFENSMTMSIWGTKNKYDLKEGQLLWFVTSNKTTNGNGRIVAVARFVSQNERLHTNEELGWVQKPGEKDWKYEINYKDLELVQDERLKESYKGQSSIIHLKDLEKIEKLDQLYNDIINFSRAVRNFSRAVRY